MGWTSPSLNLDMSIVRNRSVKNQNRMAHSVDPDETAHEPSHQDLRCLHKYLDWSARLKGLHGLNTPAGLDFCHYYKGCISIILCLVACTPKYLQKESTLKGMSFRKKAKIILAE